MKNSSSIYMVFPAVFLAAVFLSAVIEKEEGQACIRINQLGYLPDGVKVAVWGAKQNQSLQTFQVVDARKHKVAYQAEAGKAFGAYGPFGQTYRLQFSAFKKTGRYYLLAGGVRSPEFAIGADVYRGSADFCLRYMRQQRSGFNPFLQDSCHTRDGYTLYGPMADSTYVDVVGGWHDASDYLQYATTSANATYQLLLAYRDFGSVFTDRHQANGLAGKNGKADVLDEARWGLDWLLKMHPRPDWMFNQIADDRDHINMRIPGQDSQYGRGYQRPVYFITGEPQQRGKGMNNTSGTSSTAAKLSSAFALGAQLYASTDQEYSKRLRQKAASAYDFALRKPGVTQTASVKAPYIYAEDNWVDDMELAAAWQNRLEEALAYARQEPVTPWLGRDTASHYQYYPFINLGHYEAACRLAGQARETVVAYYKTGLERVWQKARSNAFYRGVPFIWCSNNLTVAFAQQCYWYRQLSLDKQYAELEQANIDWLFGLNPWGTSMVYGLPASGDTPVDPHSAFTHVKNYPIDGGLVDGPVYGKIFKSLIGIQLHNPDEYAAFQSDLVVYHDDYGDYSTNEPTMDGTASLVYLLAAQESKSRKPAGRKR
jgi:endoglucanase